MKSLSGRYRRNSSRPPSLLNSAPPDFRSSTRKSPPPDRAAVYWRMHFAGTATYLIYIYADIVLWKTLMLSFNNRKYYSFIALCAPHHVKHTVSNRFGFMNWHLPCRYFEYMFGELKKHEKSRKKAFDSDLVELTVWITAADPECDGYPSLQTDESCELFSPSASVIHNT